MAFDLSSITRGPRPMPYRLEIYGPHGVGKTTLAAQAPNPIFIQTEDGLGQLECPAFPLATSVQDVLDALNTLYREPHDFQTVVLDSADWLDNLIQADMKANHDEKARSYGKDTLLWAEQWLLLLQWFNALRRDRGMNVILIAHSEIKRFDPPDSDSYERYQPKMPAKSSAVIQEWADAVLFANFKTFVKAEAVNQQKTIKKAVASGERLLHTGEKPAYLAKNRYSLPDTIPMNWETLAAALATTQPH